MFIVANVQVAKLGHNILTSISLPTIAIFIFQIVQFIKAMRDEEGKMVKNAHLLGTMRRVLKLLFHKIRPLFVFDGATPALKLRTIEARRKKRLVNVSIIPFFELLFLVCLCECGDNGNDVTYT